MSFCFEEFPNMDTFNIMASKECMQKHIKAQAM